MSDHEYDILSADEQKAIAAGQWIQAVHDAEAARLKLVGSAPDITQEHVEQLIESRDAIRDTVLATGLLTEDEIDSLAETQTKATLRAVLEGAERKHLQLSIACAGATDREQAEADLAAQTVGLEAVRTEAVDAGVLE